MGEVRNVDALRFTNRLFRDFYSKLYIQLVQRAPTILGIVYNSTDEPWKTDRMRLMLDRLNTGPLERFIAQVQARHHGLHPFSARRKSSRTSSARGNSTRGFPSS